MSRSGGKVWVGLLLVTGVATLGVGSAEGRTPRPRVARPAGDLAVTESGLVRGVRSGDTFAFKGIPFAAPPVGELRWRPPAPPLPWFGVRDASSFGATCPQLDAEDHVVGDEDCLTLNVWTPVGATPSSRLPVLFFIHGGGHVQGSASEQAGDGEYFYDGADLASRAQAVVVTVQYRLGALGFVAIPALGPESPSGVAANFGLLDLVAALEWVSRDITGFGGDPSRVLVFGESAGAVESCMLVASPLGAGLFSAALMESGACVASLRAEAEAAGSAFVTAAGCASAADVPACLRGLSAAEAVLAVPAHASVAGRGSGFQPAVDGLVLPDLPEALLAAGRHNRVPLVVGANADETGRDAPLLADEAAYRVAVLALVGGSQVVADAILQRYPVAEYGTPRKAYVALTSDAKFICTARRAARAAAAGGSPVWRYFFTHALDNGGAVQHALGAFHGLELAFVFDHLEIAGYVPTAGERELAALIIASWAGLAATGDPGVPGAPWPPYDPVRDTFQQLEDPPSTGEGIRTAQCDFWDTFSF
jgi:para-nitrobenzyl esterase